MFDVVIRGGTVVDGSGAAPRTGDIAIRDGRIASVGERVTEPAGGEIDADGCIVTPGFVDVHTHYDGQVTWDDAIEPSATNGVTTLAMGNCGVGFAPVRSDGTATLIDLMEGVEDIPGSALSDGMPWGAWESFGEYLDVLAGREYALDIGAQLAHGALRYYVMGERGVANENATDDDLVEMARLAREALDAGAVGFSTSRTIGHRSKSGTPVPGTFAPATELVAIAEAMRDAGHGVFEAIVSGTIGKLDSLGGEPSTMLEEFEILKSVHRASTRPVTFTLAQLLEDPDGWRRVLGAVAAENAAGADLRPQIIPRSVTIMTSLDTYHLFMLRPTYRKLEQLPRAQRVAEMRKPDVREAILGEPNDRVPGFTTGIAQLLARALVVTFPLSEPIDYEPTLDRSVAAVATARGIDAQEHMYDLLLEGDGTAFYSVLGSNFVGGSLDVCREMLLDPHTVTGLSDSGAHVNLISDCSASTFHLTHWVRDRTRGERLPVETVVAKLTANNARLYGFRDRGTLAPGMRADINVIDLDNLTIRAPEVRFDLPSGASRILQPSTGYVATMVNGVTTRRDDADTGQRPGRLVRGRA